MREDYVKIIKEYISSRPDYQHTIDSIRTNTLLIGATKEEFDLAMQQLTGVPQVSDSLPQHTDEPLKKNSKIKSIIKNKKLAAVFACIAFTLIASAIIKLNTTDTNTQQEAKAVQIIKKSTPVFEQVFASSNPVNANKVFSYPPTNVSLAITGKPKKEVVGFFPYWMLDQQEQVGINGLTTIDLFGITIDAKGNIVTTGNDGTPDGGWVMWNNKKIDNLITRAKQKGLQVNVTFKSFNNTDIEKLVASDDAQKRFISNALYMINAKNLNGINIDFEYVGNPPDITREGFTRFITNLDAELKHQVPNANLTVDTYVTTGQTPGIFDIDALSEKTDALIIMGYDIHTPQGDPGAVAPMQGDSNIIGFMQNYLEKINPNKLILAVPYYGYDWALGTDNSQNPASMVPYAQAADISKSQKILWDETTQSPWYSYRDGTTRHAVYFDNVRSLSIKYDYINKKNLKGVGIWALGYDGLNTDLENLLSDKFAN